MYGGVHRHFFRATEEPARSAGCTGRAGAASWLPRAMPFPDLGTGGTIYRIMIYRLSEMNESYFERATPYSLRYVETSGRKVAFPTLG